MKSSEHQDVNEILQLLEEGLTSILGANLVGLYLMGSLTYGGFDRGSSDIDFLVVLSQKLSKKQRQKVEELHSSIGIKYPEWHKRIEGSYITKKMLSRVVPPKQSRPYVNAGKMWDFVYGNEWILNLHMLREFGVALVGPDPKKLIKSVDIKSVRESSRKNLLEEWQPKLNGTTPFKSNDYDSSHLQAYAVMTMCRILYTANNSDVVPKQTASKWVKRTYGKPWSSLIEEVERWRHGKKLSRESKVKKFIEFTINMVV